MGGRGRREASSSASSAFEREPHTEAEMPLERRLLSLSSSSSALSAVMSSVLLREIGFETGRERMR